MAGRREGFEDTRGTLFFDIARIAEEKQPKALLLENVKGLVNHDKGNTLDTMIRALNDIGYIVDFDVLNSKYFGVPQNRERIFIVAIREDLIDEEDWIYTKGQTIVPKGKRRINGWAKTFNFDFPNSETKYDHYTKSERDRIRAAKRILDDEEASEQRKKNAKERIEELSKVVEKYVHLKPKVTTRLRDILETNVDEKYYLDEKKAEELVAKLEERTDANATEYTVKGDLFTRNNPQRQNGFDDVMFTIRSTIPHGVAIDKPKMIGHVDIKGNDSIKRTYLTEGISPTLTTMGGGHREPKIEETQEIASENHISHCIDANYSKGISPNSIGKGRRTHIKEVRPKYRIRKLTPLECWRLQGFPDEAHDVVKSAGISDGQRYKQAGNAVTVPVVKAIAERLITLITN